MLQGIGYLEVEVCGHNRIIPDREDVSNRTAYR